jgi:hypothetical protein
MIKEWGIRFEREKEFLPLFHGIYQMLLSKGVEFPQAQSVPSFSAMPDASSQSQSSKPMV